MDIDDIAEVMALAVREATAPLIARLDALEKAEPPVARDGRDGLAGRDGKDGTNGIDGKDAVPFTMDDFAVNRCDARTYELSFQRGEIEHAFEIKFAVPIYRGVYREQDQYEPGDMVTWGGSVWHCDKETGDKPGLGDAWTLAVKKGRDAR